MNFNLQQQASTEEFRLQIAEAVRRMNDEDLSHVETEGILVADDAVADQFLKDPRYRHIGSERVEEGNVHVFLFAHAE